MPSEKNNLAELLASFTLGTEITVYSNGLSFTGIIMGLELEDGSRKNFLVKLSGYANRIFIKVQ